MGIAVALEPDGPRHPRFSLAIASGRVCSRIREGEARQMRSRVQRGADCAARMGSVRKALCAPVLRYRL